jgi:hypothetical protein
MRRKDNAALPQEIFPEEVKALVDHKMARLRVSKPDGKAEVRQWLFRHDKVWDYFIVQAFLGADNDRPAEYISDPRFRGAYFLLARMLPESDARALRERLIQYAAETKDHSVSDDFARRLRLRELGVGGIDPDTFGIPAADAPESKKDAEDALTE